MRIKSYKDVLVLVALVGGILLSVVGFVLYFTDSGSPLIFESIGITVFLFFGILAWLGLGVLGIIRAIGTALIIVGIVGILRKPIVGVVCLLSGFVCRYFVFWMTRDSAAEQPPLHESDSR